MSYFRSASVVVNIFPVSVVVADPQPRVGGLARDWSTGDRINVLNGADVRDACGASFVVEDVDAWINHVDVALMRAESLVQSCLGHSAVEVKLLKRFTLGSLRPQLYTQTPIIYLLPFAIDNIRVMVIVWMLRGNIIRTAPCWVV